MEGSAPAAATPTAPTGTTNGANGPHSTSVKPTAPKPNETTLGRTAPRPEAKGARDQSGKFVSPDSGTARRTQPEAEGEPEEPAPYRFKRKLKDGDNEEEVDLSEDDLLREVQIARAAKRRLGELNKRLREMDAREQRLAAAEKDPLAYLRERGADPEQLASQLLAQKAQRGLMSPEEQRIAELEETNAALEAKWKRQEQEQLSAQQAALEAKQWEQEEPQFLAEMERVKMPRNMAVLGFMSKVGTELTETLGPGVPPAVVVAETNDRLSKFAEHYILSLPVEALVSKLGPERTKAIQKLLLDRWRASQATFEPAPVVESKPPPEEPTKPKEYLSEADVRKRLQQRYGAK